MIDRHGFHLENVAGQDVTTVLEAFCLEYYGNAPSIPPQLIVPTDGDGTRGARAVPLRAARRRASRFGRRRGARSGGSRSWRRRTRKLALESETARRGAEAAAPGRGAGGAARGAQPREPAAADRVLRHLEHPGPGDRRLDGRLPGRDRRRRRTTASSACAGLDGQDDFAAMAEVVSRRFARLDSGTGRGLRRGLRDRAEPRRDRRRQGPALGRARGDAGLRAAAGGGDLAREADRGGLRPRPARSDPARPAQRRACSCCSGSATRRTASRSTSTASAGRRGRGSRSSTRSRASAPCGGGR